MGTRRTDDLGRYELQTPGLGMGIKPGEYEVMVTTALESPRREGGEIGELGRPELIADEDRIFRYEVTGPTNQASFGFPSTPVSP